MTRVELIAVEGLPEVRRGDDLLELRATLVHHECVTRVVPSFAMVDQTESFSMSRFWSIFWNCSFVVSGGMVATMA